MMAPVSLASVLLIVGLLGLTGSHPEIERDVGDLSRLAQLRQDFDHAGEAVTKFGATHDERTRREFDALAVSIDKALIRPLEGGVRDEHRHSVAVTAAWREGKVAASRVSSQGSER